MKKSRLSASLQGLLLLGLVSAPLSVSAILPKAPFPLGRSDLPEVRTVKELRPGLTHVHVHRGSLDNIPRKLKLGSEVKRDPNLLIPVREALEKAGFTVEAHEHPDYQPWGTPEPALYYSLSAGEFDSADEARSVARTLLPHRIDVIEPGTGPGWDTGPYSLNIIVMDPQKYRGKMVSGWSGRAWRSSPLELARQYNAVAATNGSWFEFSRDDIAGVPSGISIVQGEWHHEHYPENEGAPIIFIENDAEKGTMLSIGHKAPPLPKFKWAGGKSVTIDGIDRMPKENDLVAMREHVWRNAQLSHGHPDHILPVQIGNDGFLYTFKVPSDNLMLMATGNKRAILEEALESGQPVELDLKIPGRPGLNAYYTGTVLIHNGQSTGKNGTYRLAYTTIGADSEGKIYLMASDGPPYLEVSDGPVGVNEVELTKIAQFLGLINAANLDSGYTSSSMVVEGEVLGHYTDYYLTTQYDDDRRVGDAVLIIDDE